MGAWSGRGCKKAPPPSNPSHISYNDETGYTYTLPKENPKSIWISWRTPWVLLTWAFFDQNSSNFSISRNADIRNTFWHIISNSFNLFWVFKDCISKHGNNLIMSTKTATLDLLKVKVFWNKDYDVIIFLHDVTKNVYHKTQIILYMWSINQNLAALAFLWDKLS